MYELALPFSWSTEKYAEWELLRSGAGSWKTMKNKAESHL